MINAFVVLTIFAPVLGIPLGLAGLTKNVKNWKPYIFCIALSLAGFAYSYSPAGNSDLASYIKVFDSFREQSFWEAVTYSGTSSGGYGSGLFAFYAFAWLIGKIGDYHLASAITVFFIYYIGFYVTCKVGEDIGAKTRSIIGYLLFIILALNFHAVINNLRNVFAFALIGCAVFRDCYLKKRNIWTLLLYVIPIFFHTTAILYVLIRVIFIIPRKLKGIVALILLGTSTIIAFLYNILYRIQSSNFIVKLFVFAVQKGYAFFNDTSSNWGLIVQRSGSQRLSRIVYITIAIVMCISVVIIFRRSRKNGGTTDVIAEKRYENIIDLPFYTGLMAISCVQMLMPEYWRFASVLILFGAPIYLLGERCLARRTKWLFVNSVLLLTCVCTALWVREFIKEGVLLDMAAKSLLSSPIIVLVMDSLGFVL